MIGKYGDNKINKLFKQTTQNLYAYKLIFDFNNNDNDNIKTTENNKISNSFLNYLNGQYFQIDINLD